MNDYLLNADGPGQLQAKLDYDKALFKAASNFSTMVGFSVDRYTSYLKNPSLEHNAMARRLFSSNDTSLAYDQYNIDVAKATEVYNAAMGTNNGTKPPLGDGGVILPPTGDLPLPPERNTPTKKTNYMSYAGIGIAVLVAGYFIYKKFKK